MKILIAGDSFASAALAGSHGWPTLLTQEHEVVNLASPGVGQYKILCQIRSQNLNDYDRVIVSHTSPYRVHTEINPLFPRDHLYHKSDLIFSDVESKMETDPIAAGLILYFRLIFDTSFYEYIHSKCCEDIDRLTKSTKSKILHITHFEWPDLYRFDGMLNFYDLWCDNKGAYSHYNQQANRKIYDTILASLI